MDKPYEIWIGDRKEVMFDGGPLRFNARFSTESRARQEEQWYREKGYYAEIRVDGEPLDNYDWEPSLEYPEGSGG